MDVEYGTLQDIEAWMELVQQVRWNFPGLETQAALEDHRQTVLRFMGEQRALCVKDKSRIIGVLIHDSLSSAFHYLLLLFPAG